MLNRVTVAIGLALLVMIASTGVSSAASPDLEEVAIGTFLVALALMVLLLGIYLLKHAFGLDRMPPAEQDPGEHHTAAHPAEHHGVPRPEEHQTASH